EVPEVLADALVLVRDAARACLSAYPKEADSGPSEADAGRTQARGSVQDVFVTAERMAARSEKDVLWLSEGGDPSTGSGQRRPPPGRDGLGERQLDEIASLVDAAEGRTLGLFSSRRAAETAAEAMRERLPHLTTLAQGDAQLPELARQFVGDPHTCLFGTLSLWQGLDVPGETCQLVIIDRIPFPRPDDPPMSARSIAADKA